MHRAVSVLFWGLVPVVSCSAWSGFDVREGDILLQVDALAPITDPAKPTPVRVVLDNQGKTACSGTVSLRDFVDGWQAVGSGAKPFKAEPGTKVGLDFSISSGEPVYGALYPVHAVAEFTTPAGKRTLHAVRIFEVRPGRGRQHFAEPPVLPVVPVTPDSCLPLWVLKEFRPAWRYYGNPLVWKPVGWRGSDSQSRAFLDIREVARGATRAAINMHPPWHPGGGTLFCDFRLRLPARAPLTLVFANAIRDNTATEPPSDGVLFRVWVGEKADGSDARPVFERFTKSKVWVPGQVDLAPWAGKTVLLRLESNPGPKHDTTCDSSYWAEPVICAGTARVPNALTGHAMGAAAAHAADSAARALLEGGARPDGIRTFLLESALGTPRHAVVITPGKNGLLDAWFTLVGPEGTVRFHGLRIDIEGMPVGRWPPVYSCRKVYVPTSANRENGGAVWRHEIEGLGNKTVLSCTLRPERGGLRIQVACPRRLSLVSVGPWSRKAERVYYGHGFCIVDPAPFRASSGGHNLATSHVAAEFANGPAVLQAVDTPPNAFVVAPEAHVYALTTHMNTTLTLVPAATAFDAAVAYRPLFDRKPADGVQRLAGRFCFDIWGGRYADIAERMAEMFRYGLTDSILTVHVWQRWGYDYRLPDIFPPNPTYGTLGDMQKIARVCGEHDVPWGLHDNYIDFYPDAAKYSYRHICFTPDPGGPVKAWYNKGRDAQSYRWRPDRIMPFVKRNLGLIRENIHPTAYFLDVFTSAPCFDFRDQDGTFHSSLETRQCWGDVFAWIRKTLGNHAPTTSEAGDDQLIGWLDGADCQWLRLSPEHKRFTLYLPARDWERVPWFDPVNHARFILHGVGYSGRYQGGESRALHGINSDDYLSAEVLSGHALMVDAASWGRAAVRKYWFLQDVARRLALRTITHVQFDGENIHRQTVTWGDGTTVHVNRGPEQWRVAGHVLPQYGFLVLNDGKVLAALEEVGGRIMEQSTGATGWYINARTESAEPDRTVDIQPTVKSFERAGARSFRYTMVWDAKESTPKPMRIFVHFCSEKARRDDGIVFQDDHAPPVPTDQWQGTTVRITRTVQLPEDADGDYEFAVGMYGPGGRLGLRGAQAGESRVLVGILRVERKQGRISGVRLAPPPPSTPRPRPRLNPKGATGDAGFAATDGAFRLERKPGGLRLTPLLGSRPFGIVLRPGKLAGPHPRKPVRSVTARPLDAAAGTYPIAFEWKNGELRFRHDGKAFAYDVSW